MLEITVSLCINDHLNYVSTYLLYKCIISSLITLQAVYLCMLLLFFLITEIVFYF